MCSHLQDNAHCDYMRTVCMSSLANHVHVHAQTHVHAHVHTQVHVTPMCTRTFTPTCRNKVTSKVPFHAKLILLLYDPKLPKAFVVLGGHFPKVALFLNVGVNVVNVFQTCVFMLRDRKFIYVM